MRVTHYQDYDAPGRWHRHALCGAYVPVRDHSNEPTCADCQRELAGRKAREEDDDASLCRLSL
jgi:hypothetical protein